MSPAQRLVSENLILARQIEMHEKKVTQARLDHRLKRLDGVVMSAELTLNDAEIQMKKTGVRIQANSLAELLDRSASSRSSLTPKP